MAMIIVHGVGAGARVNVSYIIYIIADSFLSVLCALSRVTLFGLLLKKSLGCGWWCARALGQ